MCKTPILSRAIWVVDTTLYRYVWVCIGIYRYNFLILYFSYFPLFHFYNFPILHCSYFPLLNKTIFHFSKFPLLQFYNFLFFYFLKNMNFSLFQISLVHFCISIHTHTIRTGSAIIAKLGAAIIVTPASHLGVPPSNRHHNPFIIGLIFKNLPPVYNFVTNNSVIWLVNR